MQVELEIFERNGATKNTTKQLRRAGHIPAVLYSKGTSGKSLYVSKVAIDKVLREIEEGFLPTTVFNLKDQSGKMVKALIKDIQYQVTSYQVIHLDFIELIEGHKVEVKIPIACTGVVECVGVKAGGYLRQVMRHLPVKCMPSDIPYQLKVSVGDLDIRQARRVGDITLPEKVTTMVKPQDVVVTVVK